jgi:hypothetical protein
MVDADAPLFELLAVPVARTKADHLVLQIAQLPRQAKQHSFGAAGTEAGNHMQDSKRGCRCAAATLLRLPFARGRPLRHPLTFRTADLQTL